MNFATLTHVLKGKTYFDGSKLNQRVRFQDIKKRESYEYHSSIRMYASSTPCWLCLWLARHTNQNIIIFTLMTYHDYGDVDSEEVERKRTVQVHCYFCDVCATRTKLI